MRRILWFGVTENPNQDWVSQPARNLTRELRDRGAQLASWLGRGYGIGPVRGPDPISATDGASMRSYCLPHDQVCDWNPLDRQPDAHLDYRLNLPLWASGPGVLDLAAGFMTGRVERSSTYRVAAAPVEVPGYPNAESGESTLVDLLLQRHPKRRNHIN